MYTLALLGNVRLEGPAGPVSGPSAQRRQLAILALLATAGPAGCSRDKLKAFLWPERSTESARHSLADAVYRIRGTLGQGAVLGEREVLRLDDRIVSADVRAFEASLDKGDLERAVGLYRGRFLDGFHLRSSREFEDWRGAEARRLGQRYEEALEELAEQAGEDGDGRRASGFWERLAIHDPLNSRFVLGWMEALAESGDPGNAIQVGEGHIHSLREELGAEPLADLVAYLEMLRSGEGPRVSLQRGIRAPYESAPVTSAEEERAGFSASEEFFVGREKELEWLRAPLDGALAGRGSVAFLTGEAGTGKTALAKELCRKSLEAHARLVVAWGNGNAHTGQGDPFLPFREILAYLTGDVEASYVGGSMHRDQATRLWNLLPATVGALLEEGTDLIDAFLSRNRLRARVSAFAQEAPQVAHALSALQEEPPRPQGAAAQQALVLQFGRTLRAVSRARPILLVLDDLQWADSESVNLLFQLSRDLEGARIFFLGLFRPSDVALGRDGGRHPLEPVVNELKARFGEIELRLDEEGGRALVEALVDAEPNALGPEFRDTLLRQTRGHALFTVELLRRMREEGVLGKDQAGRWVTRGAVEWTGLPARVQAVVAERIVRLPADLRRILSVASVEGEMFTLEVVAEVLGLDPTVLLSEAVYPLERTHHLIRPQEVRRRDDGVRSIYRFRHILFQKFVYDGLDESQRAYLHARVGRALEHLWEDERGEVVLPLARHFREAGLYRKAVEYFHLAGKEAKRSAAYAESVRHWQEARRLLESLPESPDRDRLELKILSSLCLVWYGTFIEPLDMDRLVGRCIDLASRLDDDVRLFWALGTRFTQCHYRGEQDAGRAVLDEVECVVRRSGDTGQRAQFHAWMALNSLNRGAPTEALFHAEQFEAIYDPSRHGTVVGLWLQDPLPVFRALQAIAYCPLGFPSRAVECLASAWGMLDANTELASRLLVQCYDLIVWWFCRDRAKAVKSAEAFKEVGSAMGARVFAAFADVVSGWSMSEGGDPDRGVEVMEAAITELDAEHWTVWRPFVNATLADTLRRVGRDKEALDLVNRSLDILERSGERGCEAEVNRIRGEVLRSLSVPDRAQAEEAFRAAVAVARRQEARLLELRATISLARLLADQGRVEEARVLLREIYDWFSEGFDLPDLREAEILLVEMEDSIQNPS